MASEEHPTPGDGPRPAGAAGAGRRASGTARLTADDYRVRLEQFEGPLDLLLHLIRRNEVDLANIPVTPITEQYLAFLEQLGSGGARVDLELAGEFLVMAATLMEIKSRLIGRGVESPEADEPARPREAGPDPRAELVRQLLEYKRYRDLADGLDERREAWSNRHPARRIGVDEAAVRAAIGETDAVDVEDLHIEDLIEAFARIVATVHMDRMGEHAIIADDTPIELHAADIEDLLRRDGAVAASEDDRGAGLALARVFEGRTRAAMVGLFLALLDLVRRQRVVFWEAAAAAGDATGGIVLAWRPGHDDEDEHADA